MLHMLWLAGVWTHSGLMLSDTCSIRCTHHLYNRLAGQRHSSSQYLISMHCRTERFRRSFVSTVARLYNTSPRGSGSWMDSLTGLILGNKVSQFVKGWKVCQQSLKYMKSTRPYQWCFLPSCHGLALEPWQQTEANADKYNIHTFHLNDCVKWFAQRRSNNPLQTLEQHISTLATGSKPCGAISRSEHARYFLQKLVETKHRAC